MNIYTDNATGNYGFNIVIQFVDSSGVAIDISSATSKEIIFIPPSPNVAISKTASFVTDGTDGKIQYTAEKTLFIYAGAWSFYGIADETSSFGKGTDVSTVNVYYRPVV